MENRIREEENNYGSVNKAVKRKKEKKRGSENERKKIKKSDEGIQ